MTTSLPKNVYPVRDRHGKVRYRFVRRGWKTAYLPGEPGSAAFHEAYAAILNGGPRPQVIAPPAAVAKGSLDHVYAQMRATVDWTRKGERTRLIQSRIIERFLNRIDKRGRRYGLRPASAVTVMWLESKFSAMHETPEAANVLRKILAVMMDVAVKMRLRPDNPVRLTKPYPENKDGFHTWTDEEIGKFRKAHALGTMARLTLELALNTAARRCNIATLTRDDIRDGRITVAHAKGNHVTSVRMMATTKAALDALPVAPIRHLIVTQYGKPFTQNGLGNRMRKWCNEAGLPHCSMHGLRKAISRQLAEHGASDAEGQAITGHKKATTFQHYRAKADRTRLSDMAFDRLDDSNVASGDDSNPIGGAKNG